MRKKKFVCGIALCLALSVAGCGKDSKEQQAANYYQNQLGMDKEDAQDLAHELYGEDEPGNTEGNTGEIVVEPLPELLNSEWYDFKVQIYDMVFDNFSDTKEEDIRKIVEGSAYNAKLTEGFDSDGNICFTGLEIDGNCVAILQKCEGTEYLDPNGLGSPIRDYLWAKNYGLIDKEFYYFFSPGPFCTENTWHVKKDIESKEFMDFMTRDDVLTYLAENGFTKLEMAPYEGVTDVDWYDDIIEGNRKHNGIQFIRSDQYENISLDISHYYCKGAQSITLYRIHKVSETGQVEYRPSKYSDAHLNYVNSVTFHFDTDGTVVGFFWTVGKFVILGKYIN